LQDGRLRDERECHAYRVSIQRTVGKEVEVHRLTMAQAEGDRRSAVEHEAKIGSGTQLRPDPLLCRR
jgi:hypothetical protein